MKLTPEQRGELAEVAIAAATAAGQLIASSRPRTVEHKPGMDSLASEVVTEIDRQSEDIIIAHLEPTLDRFDLGVLTEERTDDGGRFTHDHFWCIDPLDGTLPFVEGRPGYSVSIALVAHDGTPLIGVIYDPVTATCVHAIAGAGAFRNGEPWTPASHVRGDELTVFADRSFAAHDRVAAAAQRLGLAGVGLHVGAGAAMNALGVLDHPPACYMKLPKPAGGGSLWDFAATACVFDEIGAVATDITGRPLDLNRADSTFMHHRGVLFATDADIAAALRTAVSEGTAAE